MGRRTVEFDEEGITVKYYSPQSTISAEHHRYKRLGAQNEAGAVSEVFIKKPLKGE